MNLPYIDQRGFWLGGKAPSKLPRKMKKRQRDAFGRSRFLKVWYSKRDGWSVKVKPQRRRDWECYKALNDAEFFGEGPFALQEVPVELLGIPFWIQTSTTTNCGVVIDWYKVGPQ